MLGIESRKKNGRSSAQTMFAQYFTPSSIAEYMASLFRNKSGDVEILDPGAGEGILGIALINRLADQSRNASATFVEIDEEVYKKLELNLEAIHSYADIERVNADFIKTATDWHDSGKRFTHVILNPPYFKLNVESASSKALRLQGIHVTNIYAGFVWLAASLLQDKGELVAIIPRSFCNGPYFLKFRQFLTENFSIDTIHIFDSRNKAFAHDSVLQENVILHISKRPQTKHVAIAYSGDHTFNDVLINELAFEKVIHPADNTKTIHIPAQDQKLNLADYVPGMLQDLEITASTGPVVDFRAKDRISSIQVVGTVPLLYPAHMSGYKIDWPLRELNKIGQHYIPAGHQDSLPLEDTATASLDKNILPLNGFYVVVRRFSSKEEKRRIFASVVDPSEFAVEFIAFENHLNYFHAKKNGFDKDLAYGLCAYLNSSIIDEHFRKVSGHTQVNVSDLKNLPYPSPQKLRKLGGIMQSIDGLMDDIVTKEILGHGNE